MKFQLSGLWKDSDFMKMWSGQTISIWGSQITTLAMPLIAATALHATATQMGILQAVEYVPFLLFGLLAGVYVDRIKRRPILIWADLVRAVLLLLVPLLTFYNWLRIEHLFVIEFLAGICTTFFAVAYQSYLPSVVTRDQLLDGNSKMEMSKSIAEIAGPGLAGILIQLLTGSGAIILNVISYIASLLFLRGIRREEPTPEKSGPQTTVMKEMREGLSMVFRNKVLKAIALSSVMTNFFFYMIQSVYVLYVTREFGLEPATIGLILGCGGFAAVFGTIVMGPLVKKFGQGWVIIMSSLVASVGVLLVPAAGGSFWAIVAFLTAAQLIRGFALVIYNIGQISLRQMITPERLQGRMNATMRSFVWGAIPLGSLLGGVFGDLIGIRPTLYIGAIGCLFACLFLIFSPLRTDREFPVDEVPMAS